MNWLDNMNNALNYIENNLSDEIHFEEISKITACPSGLFVRIFSLITGISLSEYIRRRRLSLAVADLRSGCKVIDVAIKYGYESSDAFSLAFKRQHGISPSKISDTDTVIKVYPRLTFKLSVKGVEEMNYKMVERESFNVIGKSITTTANNSGIGAFWDRSWIDGTCQKLMDLAPDKCLMGLCYNPREDGSFDYMIGLEYESNNVDGFEKLALPTSIYAVFECISDKESALPELWTRIMSEFLPSSEFRHSGAPDMEVYYKWDNVGRDFHTEVWVPVVNRG